MKKFTLHISGLIIVLCSGMISLPLFAQDEPPPVGEEWLVTPKPGHLADFMAGMAEHVAMRREANDPFDWIVYSSYAGDNFGQYSIRYCCTTWAGIDEYEQWSANQPELMQHWMTKIQPYLAETRHYFHTVDWANSHWDADMDFRFVAVDTWTIKPGHEARLDQVITQLSQIALNQGWSEAGKHWVWLHNIGGEPKITVAIPHKNFASMQQDGETYGEFLVRHLGNEKARELVDQFISSVNRQESSIWQRHPELSLGGN